NQRLFSDHYLKEVLPQTNEWRYIDEGELKNVFMKIQSLYEKERSTLLTTLYQNINVYLETLFYKAL
ncbi:hypothetical protein J7M02_00465, partial [Candidatus Aerophobetes bacterium]|nr:hypothetical protein [Candidatus Aerophobetes bacterium]